MDGGTATTKNHPCLIERTHSVLFHLVCPAWARFRRSTNPIRAITRDDRAKVPNIGILNPCVRSICSLSDVRGLESTGGCVILIKRAQSTRARRELKHTYFKLHSGDARASRACRDAMRFGFMSSWRGRRK